jgi:tRNA A37 threonylcarbamoyladenosine biosynthesis protein TsaE
MTNDEFYMKCAIEEAKKARQLGEFGDVIMNKPFIAIEGPIGVGKSSLTHKISQTFNFANANRTFYCNKWFIHNYISKC